MAPRARIAGLALLALAIGLTWWAWPQRADQVQGHSGAGVLRAPDEAGSALLEGDALARAPKAKDEPPNQVAEGTGSVADSADQVTVRGHVLDEYDTPRGDVTVRVLHVKRIAHRPRSWSATQVAELLSGDDGSFQVTVARGSTLRLTADARDSLSPSLPLEMTAEDKSVILRVQRTPNIGGRVFDERGRLRALSRVYMRWEQLRGRHEVRCDPQGRFEAAVPQGAKRVTVSTGILEGRSRKQSKLPGIVTLLFQLVRQS